MRETTIRPFGEDGPTYADIRRQFNASAYGRSLKATIRWHHFKPNHISQKEWIGLLGSDADALKHGTVMYGYMQQFIMQTPEGILSTDDKRMLLLASISNGWGEAGNVEEDMVPMGNIIYGQKTHSQEEQEHRAYQTVFQSLLGAQRIKEELIVENILFDPDSRLGQIYDAVRLINYLRTALHAYTKAKVLDDEETSNNLRWLSADVICNQLPTLLHYAKTFTAAAEYISDVGPDISIILDELPEDIFAAHGELEKVHADRFRFVRNIWRSEGKPKRKGNDKRRSGTVESKFIADYMRLEGIIAAHKTLGRQIVLTSGSFDMIHIGHAKYLETAKSYGDILVIGVDSDTKIRKRKGPDRPVVPEEERVSMLTYVRGVDYVALKQLSDERWSLIKTVRPDTLIATQETYSDEEIEALSEFCRRVIVLPPQATTSTSAKIRRLQIGWNQQVVEPIERILAMDLPDEEIRRLLGDFVLGIRNT